MFGEAKFERLARISVAQLYRVRGKRAYRQRRMVYQANANASSDSGNGGGRSRRPAGIPAGSIRASGRSGWSQRVYHINAVDEVSAMEVSGGHGAEISEAYLLPVLEAMLEQFPFRIRGFHSDNGIEFINHTVAKLLTSC